ncbi:hypothetical protein QJS10_CPB13g01237 [Acorus calamus]|uniref:Uncharacterized protein n=1 Tax=Acorus calamus TaxID=4465 RepID=A0AAV9DIJ2_ACOCL|nr:hypothetical protein QJS10_CPB13g01237 [Acorus calamus]
MVETSLAIEEQMMKLCRLAQDLEDARVKDYASGYHAGFEDGKSRRIFPSHPPAVNSCPSKDSVKSVHIKVAFKRNDRAFFKILGWDNPNLSSYRRLGPHFGDILVAPSSPINESGPSVAQTSRLPETEEYFEEDLKPIFQLGFGAPMVTESSSSATRHGSRLRKGPKSEKRRHSPTRQSLSTPSKRSKPSVAGHPSSACRSLPPASNAPLSKGKEVVPAFRLPPPPPASREQEVQTFIPTPRTKTRSIQVSDSGLKDKEMAIGLIQSVILEKDRTLAGDISAFEASSFLQSMAYQDISEISGLLEKERAKRVRDISEAEQQKREMKLDFEIKILERVRDRLRPIERKSVEAVSDGYDMGYRKGFQDCRDGAPEPGLERVIQLE